MGKTPAVLFVFVGYGIVIPGSGDRGFLFLSLFRLVPEIAICTVISSQVYFENGALESWYGIYSVVRCNNKMLNTREKEKPCYFLSMASPRS